MDKTILIIDGSNLLYRAYYATENKEMHSPLGMDVNAINTVASMLKKYVDQFQPTYMYIALDEGKNTFRHQAYEDYKITRSKTPQRLVAQFPLVKEMYDEMGIIYGSDPLYEADDLIASVSKLAQDNNINVQIISGDKDILQLVNEHVKVFVPKSNSFGKDINYTPAIFEEKYQIKVDDWILYKALVGDKSDNIIGVPKIGDKTAISLINTYHTFDNILKAAQNNELKPLQNKNIVEYEALVRRNLELVTLHDDVDVNYNIDQLLFANFKNDNLLTFFHKHGMQRNYTLFQKIIDKPLTIIGKEFEEIKVFDKKYIGKENYLYTQSLGENYHITRPLGFGIANEKGLFYLNHDNINQNFLDFIQDDSIKITYDLKQLMGILKINQVGNFICDLKIANSVLNPDNYKKSLDYIALEYQLDNIYSYQLIYGSKTNPQYDLAKIKIDITLKASILKDLFIIISNQLEQKELKDVYYNIEHPLIPILAKMENYGVVIDTKRLKFLQEQYANYLEKINQDIQKITDININSPQQLSNYLFGELQLSPKDIKKTQSGYSTDQDALQTLLNQCEDQAIKHFLSLILEYRQVNKIYTSYLLGLEKFIINDKIHPIYHQLLTETGRLSAMEPNIQNIPTKTSYGKAIRSIFIAPQGYDFVCCDYSQVELRIIAILSNETNMLQAFKNHEDIHSATAQAIFKTDKITSQQRSEAKAINFGIIYGISGYGLAKQINSSIGQANQFINDYLTLYPQIKKYQQNAINKAFEKGYTKTLFNRIRYINPQQSNKNQLENIKRICINTPIQGTAADIIKLAMIKIDKYFQEAQIDGIMSMQIHDELCFYIKHKDSKQVSKMIVDIMENIVDFPIDLEVSCSITNNWMEAK